MNLAERIRLYRKRTNLMQQELAKLINVSVMTIKRWEWSQRIPRSDELQRLAAALNTTTDYLLNGESPESRESLPINNAPMEVAPDYLDLGYWGNVAENASRAARSGDRKKIALITPLVKSAFEVLSEAENLF